MSPWEMILRGTLMYWFLFFIFRWVMRRRVGAIALTDILLLVLIADAAENVMAGEYKSFPEGAVLVGTIVSWNMLVDWASFRFEPFRRFAEPRPLLVISQGRTEEELISKLCEKGVDDVSTVKTAYIESDGEFSVVKRDGTAVEPKSARKSGSK